ncbi:MAG: response regulator transcription factor [Bacteriovoracia bacterium]
MKGNLLLVDDEEMLVKTLAYTLQENCEKILTAHNGLEALEVLKREPIHCILCDINMPKMNGVELLKKVREDNKKIPFIFYTGHGNKGLMIEAAKYGALDFLSKPHLEGLEEVVNLGLRQGLSPEDPPQESSFISEYQDLLKELGKSPGKA